MYLNLAARCNRGSIPASNQPQLAYILIEISPNLAEISTCLPIHAVVLLDRSGPAMLDSLPAIKQALRDLIDFLQPSDYLSIIALSGEVLLPAQTIDKGIKLKRAVDGIRSVEEKRSARALDAALQQSRLEQVAGRATHLVFILGGTIASEEQNAFLALSDQATAQLSSTTGIGIGYDWDERFLLQLVMHSSDACPDSLSGAAYYVPSSEEVGEVASELFRSLHVVARQAQITTYLVRGVEVRQVWQVLPMIKNLGDLSTHGQTVSIPLGDLAENGSAFLLEVVLPPRASGKARIAQVEASCAFPQVGPQKVETDLVVDFSIETGGTNPLDCYVMDFVETAQAYRLNCMAMAEMEVGDRRAAAQKFRQAAAILVSQNRLELADRIRGEADYNLRQYGKISSEARKMILLASRRTFRTINTD